MKPKTLYKWRVPEYLSPSALGTWISNQEEYFLKYLATNRPPRFLQNNHMAVGSAFDAFVKGEIANRLWGTDNREELFERQVESHNRDEARIAGQRVYDAYCEHGALDALVRLLEKSAGEPRMEFAEQVTIDGVVLLGKPDLTFYYAGHDIQLDWKVNGYYSASPVTPVPGFRFVFPSGRTHKDYHPMYVGDLEINHHPHIQAGKPDWGRQLSVYGWIAGIVVGGPLIGAVDQIVARGNGRFEIAQHRCMITPDFQKATFEAFKELWAVVHSNHIFRHLSEEESDARCEVLNQQAAAYKGDEVKDAWLRGIYGRGEY